MSISDDEALDAWSAPGQRPMRPACAGGWMTWERNGRILRRNPCGHRRKPGLERDERTRPLKHPSRHGKSRCAAGKSAPRAYARKARCLIKALLVSGGIAG